MRGVRGTREGRGIGLCMRANVLVMRDKHVYYN
jgi:hypothetical protein